MNIPLKSQDNKHTYILLIEIYNPILRLKKREKEVLLFFLLRFKELYDQKVSDALIADDLISTPTRQYIRELVKMSEPSFNNHILQLKRKGILVEGTLMNLLANVIKVNDLTLSYTIE